MQAELARLQAVVDARLCGRRELRALDAGCGAAGYVRLPAGTHVTGIDVSPGQLARNRTIHERVLGDVQRYPLPAASYDVVVCWWLLEHLADPERTLCNLVRATRDGGLLVLAVPNVRSVKGLVTRWTPHCFHIWMYRHCFGDPLAGRDGRPPCPARLHRSLAVPALERFAREHGLAVEFGALFEARKQRELRRRFGLVGLPWWLVRRLTALLSLGRWDAERTDYFLVWRKGAAG